MSGFSPADDVRLKYRSVLIIRLYGGLFSSGAGMAEISGELFLVVQNGRRPLTSFLILEVKVKSQSKESKTVRKKYDFMKSCNQVFHFGLNRSFGRS